MTMELQLCLTCEDDYMSDEQLQFFKTKLESMRNELLESLNDPQRKPQQENCADEFDRASQEEAYWLELRIRERETQLLKKITQALGRIERGEYGYCDDTGEPIGLERMLARPTAHLSAEAQRRRERRQKLYAQSH